MWLNNVLVIIIYVMKCSISYCDELSLFLTSNDCSSTNKPDNNVDIHCNSSKIPLFNQQNFNHTIMYHFYLNNQESFKEIHDYAFANLKIATVDLQNNSINAINKLSFANLTIINLILNDNNISYIDREAFISTSSTLKNLILDKNNLIKMNQSSFENVFSDLTELGFLTLEANNLTYLPYLGNLKMLTLLSLSRNNLLSLKTFSGNSTGIIAESLNFFNLNSNLFTEINSDMFLNLKNLEYLLLSSNNISKIDNLAFKDNINMKTLDLSSNSISSLPIEAFNNLKSIKLINLASQNVESFKLNKNAFMNLENVIISFQHNRLVINKRAFCINDSFISLNLQLTDVSFTDEDDFDCVYYNLFKINTTKFEIRLGCDCYMLALKKMFNNSDNVNIICEEPIIDDCDYFNSSTIETTCNKVLFTCNQNDTSLNEEVENDFTQVTMIMMVSNTLSYETKNSSERITDENSKLLNNNSAEVPIMSIGILKNTCSLVVINQYFVFFLTIVYFIIGS